MIPAARILFIGALFATALLACGGTSAPAITVPLASSGPQATGPSGFTPATQRDESGQVTVEATWTGLASGATFEVKLDTHAVDLDAIDFANALLHNDRAQTLTASPWTAPKGGHHRQGTLTFNGDAATFLAGTKWIELTMPDIGGVPQRTLHWGIGT